jgi:hypothetical protein
MRFDSQASYFKAQVGVALPITKFGSLGIAVSPPTACGLETESETTDLTDQNGFSRVLDPS